MLKHAANKYRPGHFPVALADRQWPNRRITRAPIWMSTDLRDGNQALFEPMDAERKLQFFKMLCDMGFKEIEVAFPSASQTDFDFVRTLIEGGHIPEDVTIEVLTQGREHLIRRTFESLQGARRAIVHIYNALAPDFRRIVFGQDGEAGRATVKAIAVESARLIRDCAATMPETEWVFEYSPETFTATELEFSLEVCNAVTGVWDPSPARPIILNLPATVEVATPNVYADQIEWMHRHLDRRDSIILSVHPHNDRGTAVAAAELAMLAGADRVEGCLFGNGERTGNVDLVTLALNLYTHGIDPGLDFSRINQVARTVEDCNQLPIHPRHPYAGDLVFTAFSGSHQDAIRKGFEVQDAGDRWTVPYLPVDPADLGRTYDSIIRVNSQSGKGGVAHLLETGHGISLPRRMQVEFSGVVQQHTEATGGEVSSGEIWRIFQNTYLSQSGPLAYQGHHLFEHGEAQGIRLTVSVEGHPVTLHGEGNGPIDACLQALAAQGLHLSVESFEERSIGQGAAARAIALVEAGGLGTAPDEVWNGPARFGAGIDDNIVTASLQAVISAANRLMGSATPAVRRAILDTLLTPSHRAA